MVRNTKSRVQVLQDFTFGLADKQHFIWDLNAPRFMTVDLQLKKL